MVISVTATGTNNPESIVLRSGAKANDLLVVTGDLGAAYLVYLAWKAIAPQKGNGDDGDIEGKKREAWQSYRQGFITNILNPKSVFFYLAFVPQFTDPDRGSVFAQFILLGVIFNVMGNSINLFFALMARRISVATLRHPQAVRIRQWLTASIFAGIAVHLVASK